MFVEQTSTEGGLHDLAGCDVATAATNRVSGCAKHVIECGRGRWRRSVRVMCYRTHRDHAVGSYVFALFMRYLVMVLVMGCG